MTNQTGIINETIKVLEIIDNQFMPVKIKHEQSIDKHLDEFLNLFHKYAEISGIYAVVPAFYEIEDFNSWDTKPFFYFRGYSKLSNLVNIFNIQTTISKKSEIHFSKSICEYLNQNNCINGRMSVLIRQSENENLIFHKNDSSYLHIFKIPKKITNKLYSKPYNNKILKTGNIIDINFEEVEGITEYKKYSSFISEIPNIKDFIDASILHSLYINDKIDLYYFFSNLILDNSDFLPSDKGLGGVFVLADKQIADHNRSIKFQQFIQLFEKITDKIAIRIVNHYQLLSIIKHATRAAISQVMARNMSHNIGSHVLSKLLKDEQISKVYFKNKEGEKISHINDIQSILTNGKVFYQCLNVLKDTDIESSGKISTKNKENNESLLATFFNYLKARMDFLADVTTSTPVIENIRGFYTDIIKPFICNRVLNDRISGIDTFNYEIIGCKPDCTTNNGNNCKDIITKDNCYCKLNDATDLQVSVPNDVLGIQAFYTILENIIRNTAKHGTTPLKKVNMYTEEVNVAVPFEFKIKIEEANLILPGVDILHGIDLDEYYAISIFDNCDLSKSETIEIEKLSLNVKDELKKKQCYQEKISDGKIKKIDKLVIDQNHILNKSILVNNQLRHGGWGLIEMLASAAYLRKIPIELIDSDKYEIMDLHGESPSSEGRKLCIYQAYAEQDKYLGYRFFVYKPREILLIGDIDKLLQNENDKEAKLKDLKSNGIWIKSKNEIEMNIDNRIIFPHRLIVITDNDKELYKKIQNNPCFSKRILKLKKSVDINYDDLKSIWQKLYDDLDDNNKKYKRYNADEFAVDDHGKNYCTFRKRKFVEIPYSATKHFFNVTAEKELNMEYSWPLRIAVIDERIQYFAEHEKYAIEMPNDGICKAKAEKKDCLHESNVPYSELYKKTNILVPTQSDCDLNEQNFYEQGEPEYKKIAKYIQNEFFLKKDDEQSMPGCEFLVIHLGIIEKLIAAWNYAENSIKYDKEKQKDVKKFIKKVLFGSDISKKLLKTYYDKIIVTSGRGKPHNLPTNIRYVNFSVISQYLITQRNKYAFTEALYSARKT